MITEMDHFSKEVCAAIGSYVYRLIDPRNGLTFYVGKGRGNRVFAHVNEALSSVDGETFDWAKNSDDSYKIQTIKDIHNAGLEVIYVIQRWGLDDDTAFQVEGALIDAYFGLTNKIGGHNGENGACNAEWLEAKFKKETYVDSPINPGYIIVKIHWGTVEKAAGHDKAERMYNACRGSWGISGAEAKNVSRPYVLCAIDGVVEEVYHVQKWSPANGIQKKPKFVFTGSVAEDNVRNIFIDKKLPDRYCKKGSQASFLLGRSD
jgi:uncharacterized protein